jgi:hypothetical protein
MGISVFSVCELDRSNPNLDTGVMKVSLPNISAYRKKVLYMLLVLMGDPNNILYFLLSNLTKNECFGSDSELDP